MRPLKPFAALALLAGLALPLVATATPAGAVPPACPAPVISGGGTIATVDCTYTGGLQTWRVPTGVTSATFNVYGAQGGTSGSTPAAAGGLATATLTVTPGNFLTVTVGGAGGNGGVGTDTQGSGGFGYGTGGAGASGITDSGGGGGGSSAVYDTTTSTLEMVAGGGGGSSAANVASGGGGGGLSGQFGDSDIGGSNNSNGTNPGTQAAAGTSTDASADGSGTNGGVGIADTSNCASPTASEGGGGGGGGFFGGAGGLACAGGGGGSGFIISGATATSFTSADNLGDGGVRIVYAVPFTLTTTPGATGVTLGTTAPTLTDSAVLSGAFNPTGTITFTLYDGSTLVDTEMATVNGNGTYATPSGYALPTTGTVTGTYQWDASYSGDTNNGSLVDSGATNEQVTVSNASPSITTTPSPATVTLTSSPQTLNDSAVLSGGYYPSGTITFTLYDGSTLVDTEEVSVNGNGTYSTPSGYALPTSGTVTGTYQWDASYSGDTNNNGASETSNLSEQAGVTSASPGLSMTPNVTTVTLGGTPPVLTDSASLSGGYAPTGTLTFTLYRGSTLVDTEMVTVAGNGSYTTPTGYHLPTTGTVAGTYQWDASYNGDTNNNGASDTSNSNEQVVVSKGNQTISFAALADRTFGDPPFGLSATASSGLTPVTFSSTTTGVCTVSGSTVTILHVGTCTIDANQAGSALWNAAPTVARSFTVHPETLPEPTGLGVAYVGGGVTATWNPVAPATGYVCTLLYGFGAPTTFVVATTATTCSFSPLNGSVAWGVSVVAVSSDPDWTTSAPAVGFTTPTAPTPPPPAAHHHAPGAPTIVVTSRSRGTITIALAGPTANGGDPIEGYEVSVGRGAWTLVTLNGHHVFTVGGLRSGRTYSVRLRAFNAEGAGASSASASVRVR